MNRVVRWQLGAIRQRPRCDETIDGLLIANGLPGARWQHLRGVSIGSHLAFKCTPKETSDALQPKNSLRANVR